MTIALEFLLNQTLGHRFQKRKKNNTRIGVYKKAWQGMLICLFAQYMYS